MPLPTGRPVVIVNYKTYPQATGRAAFELTEALERAVKGAPVTLAIAPQAADILRCARSTVPVLAQHVDGIDHGNGTGATLPEAVREAGAAGSLVNHAERRLSLADIEAACLRLRALDLTSVVCTNNVAATRAAAALSPDFVAIEPPELIGGDVSVTSADPEIVASAVKVVKAVDPRVRVLCGAGVKSAEDLRAALRLGTDGVLLASGVVKAKDPEAAMRALLNGLR